MYKKDKYCTNLILTLCNSEQFPVLTSRLFTFCKQYVHKHLSRSYVIRRDLFQIDKAKCVGLGYSTGYSKPPDTTYTILYM
jgi:hypothetical protein